MRIVIVEDSPQMLELLSEFTKQYFDDVVTHLHASRACQDIRANGVDILLCDMNISGVSGTHVIDVARCANDDCAVILCSGGGFGSLEPYAPTQKRFFYLFKPFTDRELRMSLYGARESLPKAAQANTPAE